MSILLSKIQLLMKASYFRKNLLLFLFFSVFIVGYSQVESNVEEEAQTEGSYIAIDNISEESERISQELSSFNLVKCANFLISTKKNKINPKIVNCSIRNSNNIFKELYKRFVIPFYILLLSLVPLLLIILSKEDSRYSKLKLITFLIGLFFIIFSETTIRLISDSLFRNIVISLLPIVFIITLYLIFVKKFNYKYLNK